MAAVNPADYFETDTKDECVRFMGEKLICYVPMKYADIDCLNITSVIDTIGVFTMVINDTITCGLQILAMITMDPSDTHKENIDGKEYLICELHKGDKILCTTNLVQNDHMGLHLWRLGVAGSNLPSYVDYDKMSGLFDDVKEFTGKGLGANHAVYEVIVAHLNRDPKDPTKLWRYTAMPKGEKPKQLTLRSVAQTVSGTHALLAGSYFNETLSAALTERDEDTDPNSLENLFRA